MLYTVYKPLNNDSEFQSYVDLLLEKNVDVSRLERVREKGVERKWLYAWPTRELAEQFAQELRQRLQDPEWRVLEFEAEGENTGVEIEVHVDADGRTFRLSKDSIRTIKKAFPGTNPVSSLFIGNETLPEYERQFGSIENQVIILLTSLSPNQLEILGGVSFRQFGGEMLSPSAYESVPSEYQKRSEKTASEIDDLATAPHRFQDLLAKLISLTVSDRPWTPDIEVNPFRGGLESQYWHWNRAGSSLLKSQRFKEASELFAAHYLSLLTLQMLFGHRYHKGMPLCNLGVALASAGNVSLARQSWVLGLIEDSVTNRSTAAESNNYKNLLPHVRNELLLDNVISNVDHLVRGNGVMPIVPESIVIQCLDPLQQAASKSAIHALKELLQSTRASPVALPRPYEERVAELWDQIGLGQCLREYV